MAKNHEKALWIAYTQGRWLKTDFTIVFAVKNNAEWAQRWPKRCRGSGRKTRPKAHLTVAAPSIEWCKLRRRGARGRRPPWPRVRRWAAVWLCVVLRCDHNFLFAISPQFDGQFCSYFDTKEEIGSRLHRYGTRGGICGLGDVAGTQRHVGAVVRGVSFVGVWVSLPALWRAIQRGRRTEAFGRSLGSAHDG